jgi:hypothetical protein
MARGDGGKKVFETVEDHLALLSRLGEACASHGWRVHAWVLMGNHFHLLLETPQANRVTGSSGASVLSPTRLPLRGEAFRVGALATVRGLPSEASAEEGVVP